MKLPCYLLFSLILVSARSGRAQQMALLDAPDPVNSKSSSLAEPSSSAIMPGPAKRAPREMQSFAAQDWMLLGAAAALRFGDYKSTVQCMSDPANFRELELPQALVHNRPGLGGFEASMVAVNYYTYWLLLRHNHRTMARVGQYINVGAIALTVGRNYYELNEFWPHGHGLHPAASQAAAAAAGNTW